MLLPVDRLLVTTDLDDQVPPDPLNLLIRQSAPSPDKLLDAPVLPPDQRQRAQHGLRPRADHPLGGGAVALERARPRQVPDELGAPVAQAQVRQRILVGDGVVGHAAQRQHQRAQDARPVLASRAVRQDRRRGLRWRGEVPQDGGEGLRARWVGAALQDAVVDVDEALFVLLVLARRAGGLEAVLLWEADMHGISLGFQAEE